MNKNNRDKLACEHKVLIKREKKLTYKGVTFCSHFEREVAVYLDQINISWQRNEKSFPAIMEDGSEKHFVPDFYLPDYDIFVESKGIWWTKEKRVKTFRAVEQNNLNFVCIMLKDWQKSKKILRYKIEDKINENNIRA